MKKLFDRNKSFNFNWIGFVCCGLLTLSACKENTILPPDLVPLVDNINTFQQDTFTVRTFTTLNDSLLTGGILNTTNRASDENFSHAIGSITNDLVFGRTYGASYVQVIQPDPSFNFSGTNRDVDSIILAVNYIQAYGDTMSPPMQTFNIYQAENLTRNDAYYEFSKPTNLKLITTENIFFNSLRVDSPLVNGQKLRPQMRIRLPKSFEDSLFAQTAAGVFSTYDSFLDWFGGFYIEPDSTIGNTLGYFDTDNTAMYVYYRYDENGQRDTAVATFAFNGEHCNRFNHISRNYTASPSFNFLNTGAILGDSLIFLQGDPGMAGLINFPYIGNFENSIINKAELTFTVVSPYTNYSDTSMFNIPDELQFVYVNEYGEDELLPDYTVFGLLSDQIGAAIQRVGANRDWGDLSGMQRIQYKCNITNTIQNAVTRQDGNFSLKISGTGGNYPANSRVVLRGSGSGITLEKPNLNIIFTKIQR